MAKKRLGVGIIGSGFIARFHILSWQAVRDADILGIWSPNRQNAESAAAYARELRVGEAKAYASITDMVLDPAIDAIWICGPNHRRIENLEEIVGALKCGKEELVGVASDRLLASKEKEARRAVELIEKARALYGYLQNQLFKHGLTPGQDMVGRRGPSIAGRSYLSRAAQEN